MVPVAVEGTDRCLFLFSSIPEQPMSFQLHIDVDDLFFEHKNFLVDIHDTVPDPYPEPKRAPTPPFLDDPEASLSETFFS